MKNASAKAAAYEAKCEALRTALRGAAAQIDTARIENFAEYDSLEDFIDLAGLGDLEEVAEAHGLIASMSVGECRQAAEESRRRWAKTMRSW